ncbi:hypothetical protein DNTS_018315 [Danionella cerebrum]|uniref:Fibronectin type-III domain-containing protein n=1 Tax=Danionella cerebrum TaxID=2873325 RepID=A0A553QEQ1_9TELE|nr:hypothetical protein DNTS_018315 [Danionella translucida]
MLRDIQLSQVTVTFLVSRRVCVFLKTPSFQLFQSSHGQRGSHNPPPLPSLGLYLREEVDDQTFLLRSDSSPPRSSPDSYEIIPWQIQSRGSSPSVADLRAASEPRALLSEPEGIETRFMNFRKDQTEKAPVEPLEPNHGEEESSVELRMEGVRSSADCLVSLMASALMFLKQLSCIYCTLLCLGNLSSVNSKEDHRDAGGFQADVGNPDIATLASDPVEVAALGRPLFPGMLYDCRKDSFIPGVTLWEKKELEVDVDTRPLPKTELHFRASDSLTTKSNLLDVSASLKASFLGGLVEVGGSAKFLRDSKSSQHQTRVTMYYSESTRFEQLSMSHLGKITYPQVFDQKTATHVVTAVQYGAQVFMVFDRTVSGQEDKQEVEGELNVMINKIPLFSVEGKGSLKMTDDEKKLAESISCTFYGDIQLEQNPTTYLEAVELYKKLPSLLKNSQKSVPIKVWLYPLYLLDTKAAQLERDISTSLVSNMVDITEELGEVERSFNDLSRDSLVNAFSDIKERLHSFQSSFRIYRSVFLKAVGRVLPSIRGGAMEEKSLEDILNTHRSSPFTATKLNQWLTEAKTELQLLRSFTKTLVGIQIEDPAHLNSIFLDFGIDAVVCLTFTSLKYEDPSLSALNEFLKSDKFQVQDGRKVPLQKRFVTEESGSKWFNDPDVILKMRENLSLFKSFSEANKVEKRIRFIISAIADPSSPGSSIYLYEKGKLTNKHFQPLSKPPPPQLTIDRGTSMSLKLQKSPVGETVKFRVEYKQIKAGSAADKDWAIKESPHEAYTLDGLDASKPYLIRARTVGIVGVSEASDTISPIPLSARPTIVGGAKGSEVTLRTSAITTIRKFIIHHTNLYMGYHLVSGIQVVFSSGERLKVGTIEGITLQEMTFDDTDKIIGFTLWPTADNNRLCGIEFKVAKGDGSVSAPSTKCASMGQPTTIDVKSGRVYGVTFRNQNQLNALGFYFI